MLECDQFTAEPNILKCLDLLSSLRISRMRVDGVHCFHCIGLVFVFNDFDWYRMSNRS
jgi:hypothetical protein